MASSVTHHLTPSLRQRHQFGNNNNGTTKALRRSGVPTAGRRVSSTSPMAFFIPNLIPNPNYRWGDDSNPDGPNNNSVADVLAIHKKWKVGHEHGYDETDTIWRKFKCRDLKAGHSLLEAMQGALYQTNEKGCRIRRETQGLYYMCCDGVRVRLNETKREVLVEVPMPEETNEQISECAQTLTEMEGLAKLHSKGHRA